MNAQRITALMLVIALAGLTPLVWPAGGLSLWKTLRLTGPVMLLGTWYVLTGGLPGWAHDPEEHVPVGWLATLLAQLGIMPRGIHRDDDPSNLPVRVWMPILAGFLLVIAILATIFIIIYF